ncbi:MAG: 3-mercaptopyruvate sulfurtransferase [Sphingobium sp.]
MDILVSTQWLADEIGATDLRIVDATYFLPEAKRDAAAEYAAEHVAGALYLNLTELVDSDNPLPNTLPPAEKFASRIAALGIGDGSRIVFYDNSPHRTAARAWWLFRLYGVEKVAILDGGLAKWKAEGLPVESGLPAPRHRHFTVRPDLAFFRDQAGVADAIASDSAGIVDARSPARFTGEEAETRPGVASGHMPGARNLPYSRFFHADGTWKRGDELKALFTEAGIDLDRPMITTCGSGITAAVVLFGAALLGKSDVSLYDGSWSEWGADPAAPKVTGTA